LFSFQNKERGLKMEITFWLHSTKSLVGTRASLHLYRTSVSREDALSIPDEIIGIFIWPNPSSRIMALRSTLPLTEMSTRKFSVGKGRSARKADNLTAICEPRRLTTLWAFTACYRNSFTFFTFIRSR
jgi:hypothetical protein